MLTKALYFPYIKTPSDAWFMRVLLFWDSVGTILPGNLENDERFVTRHMRELRDEGLLEDVRPVLDFQHMPRFRQNFLTYLDADEATEQRRLRPFAESATARVHLWKLAGLLGDLVERNLARPATGAGWELWADVEERTADLFMAYLAATLGPIQNVPMDPVTDREQAMAALWGADTKTGVTLRTARAVRLSVLDELLPAPAYVPAAELADFKRAHAEELVAFRDCVNSELVRSLALNETDARDAEAQISLRSLLRQRDELVNLMVRRQWPTITFGSVASLVAAAGAVAAPFVVGGGAETAAFSAPGLIPAIYGVLRDAKPSVDLMARPMAYAALVQKRFGRHSADNSASI